MRSWLPASEPSGDVTCNHLPALTPLCARAMSLIDRTSWQTWSSIYAVVCTPGSKGWAGALLRAVAVVPPHNTACIHG